MTASCLVQAGSERTYSSKCFECGVYYHGLPEPEPGKTGGGCTTCGKAYSVQPLALGAIGALRYAEARQAWLGEAEANNAKHIDVESAMKQALQWREDMAEEMADCNSEELGFDMELGCILDDPAYIGPLPPAKRTAPAENQATKELETTCDPQGNTRKLDDVIWCLNLLWSEDA